MSSGEAAADECLLMADCARGGRTVGRRLVVALQPFTARCRLRAEHFLPTSQAAKRGSAHHLLGPVSANAGMSVLSIDLSGGWKAVVAPRVPAVGMVLDPRRSRSPLTKDGSCLGEIVMLRHVGGYSKTRNSR